MKIDPFEEADMIRMAQRALSRIDKRGRRGAEECPVAEVEAMAGMLAVCGLAPLPHDEPPSLMAHERRIEATVRRALALARVELEAATPTAVMAPPLEADPRFRVVPGVTGGQTHA